jgi:hypothetical protein
MKFRKRAALVDAVQLTWSTWSEMCDLTEGDTCEGCYVGAWGTVTRDANARMGMLIQTDNPAISGLVTEGEWVVREVDGRLGVYGPDAFRQEFEPAEDPSRRETTAFKPDWDRYPSLSGAVGPLPDGVLADLKKLLADARADAVRYVHDVRDDELAKARADERKRAASRQRLLEDALRQTLARAGVLQTGAQCTGPELLAAATAYCEGAK